MTWFSLPETQTVNHAAFHDAASAADWLARQPQANVAAMLDGLVAQLRAFNVFAVSPRERYKTLEVLRKTVFAVSGESQRRFDNKPLPLSPAEQAVLDATRRLWRASAVGYLHCLRACLDGDEGLSSRAAKVTHRAMTALRMEQLCCYLAGCEVDEKFWHHLHAVYASGEKLGVLTEPVADALPRETAESSINGQYGMALLLHLANPFALTRSQFWAAHHWLARWREQTVVQAHPASKPGSCCLALDLAGGSAIHDRLSPAREGRWLVLDLVLRKMRKRLEALHAGESPENLKLGNSLSAGACIALLETLVDHLRFPPPTVRRQPKDVAAIEVVPGIDNLYRLLGGKNLQEPLHSASLAGRIKAEQLAVFGHVVESTPREPIVVETWLAERLDAGAIDLRREVATNGARLMLRGVIGVRLAPQEKPSLALISQLAVGAGTARLSATLLPGDVHPVVAEVRDKSNGKVTRQPALRVTGPDGAMQMILPIGAAASRLVSLRLYDGLDHSPLACRLETQVERGADAECWTAINAVQAN